MKRNSLIFIFTVLSVLASAQQRQPLKGIVVAGNIGLSGKVVVNVNSHKEIVTDSVGNFALYVAVNDTLLVANSRTNSRKIIAQEDLKGNMFIIDLGAYELDEVVVENKPDAKSLGLVKKDIAAYTPAERRYREGGRIAPSAMQEGGLALPVGSILNAITGKRAALKKSMQTEKKEKDLEEISYLYTEEQVTEKFYIPAQYVKGFLFYAIEDKGLTDALKAQNKALIEKLMSTLAFNYLDMVKKDEK